MRDNGTRTLKEIEGTQEGIDTLPSSTVYVLWVWDRKKTKVTLLARAHCKENGQRPPVALAMLKTTY